MAKDLYFSAPFFQAVAARYCAVHACAFCEFLGCQEPVDDNHAIVVGDTVHECYPHGFVQNAIDVPMYWRLPRGTIVQWSLRDLLQKRRGDFDEPCERRHYEYVGANYLPHFLLGRCTVAGGWAASHCLPRPESWDCVIWDTLSDAMRSLPKHTRKFFDEGIEFVQLHCLGHCPDEEIRRLQQSTYVRRVLAFSTGIPASFS